MNIKMYQSGLKFLLINAVKKLYNGDVIFHFSMDKGMYATIKSSKIIGKKEVNDIKIEMKKMVERNISFNKKIISKKEAYDYYQKCNNIEKAENVLNISNATVSMYEFNNKYNYFYSKMPENSKDLEMFDIYFVSNNEIVLIYPTNNEIKFTFRNNVYNCFLNNENWLNRMKINYVSDINNIIAEGKIKDLIKKNDIKIDNDLYEIATNIIEENKKIVLIAGPSSSGKTTTSKKLSLYLSSMGYNAVPVSLDDYYLDHGDEKIPVDEYGNPNYESVDSLDLELFSNEINDLINGKEMSLSRFDFVAGKKVKKDTKVKIDKNDIIVIEGLHGLNPKIIAGFDSNLYYKIYISPLTTLSVDRHNYISTSDNRLLRRIIRDFRTRGRSAEETIESWDSVRKGEEKYIFPYTDTADATLNTAYSYEIGVLKVYVEPLLYNIKMNSPYYDEARRLLGSLKVFYTIPSENVSYDNLLREFIGGSSFEE